MEELTSLKLRQTDLVFFCNTVDPARNSETERQHVPDTQDEKVKLLNKGDEFIKV